MRTFAAFFRGAFLLCKTKKHKLVNYRILNKKFKTL